MTVAKQPEMRRAGRPRHRSFPNPLRKGGSGVLRVCVMVLLGLRVTDAQVLEVDLRAVRAPAADETTDLPLSIPTVCVGREFQLEVWVTNTGPSPPGITGGTVDMTFSPEVVAADGIDHGSVFDLLTTGSIDEPNARVLNVGGVTLEAGVATAPTWALLSRILFIALAEGEAEFGVSEGKFPFALTGGNPPLDDSDVLYGPGLAVHVSVIRVFGDSDCDDDVDLEDYSNVAPCLARQGSSQDTCSLFDSDGDGDVDLVDFADIQTSFSGSIP